MNKVVHFEMPFDNKERAKKFYTETFGWKFDEMPEIGYIGITTTPTDGSMLPKEPGAINGGFVERTPDNPNPVVTIDVDSIDAYLEKVTQAGGPVLVPKGEVPHMGFFAYFKDTEGNVVGLWQNA